MFSKRSNLWLVFTMSSAMLWFTMCHHWHVDFWVSAVFHCFLTHYHLIYEHWFFISTKAMIMLYNVSGLCVWIRWFLDITSASSLVRFLPHRGFAVKLASCHCCDAVCCLQQSLLHSKSLLKECGLCLLLILDLIFWSELIQDINCR